MARDNWRNVLVVGGIQILGQSVFFAQGILSAEELSAYQPQDSWLAACAPLFYGAVQHLSGVWWKRIIGRGNRWTTMLGALIVAIAVAAAVFQNPLHGDVTYALLGGTGMGLIALQLKSMKSPAVNGMSLWGVGVTGIGLALWPLIACFFAKSYGPRLALLPLAGIVLHAAPVSLLLTSSAAACATDDQAQQSSDDCAATQTVETLPDVINLTQGQYTLIYRQPEYETRRIRPPNCVEVLPGIPEESEHDSDHNQHHEGERLAAKVTQAKKPRNKRAWGIRKKYKIVSKDLRDAIKIKRSPFNYAIFMATVLLRIADDLCLSTVISIVPIFATNVMPQLPIGEKAMLISLCGFSRMFTEWPLLAHYKTSKSAKFILLTGPILACVGWYLLWHSESVDAITMATISLGIGSGAAITLRRVFAPEESPNVEDATDVIIGIALLATTPLAHFKGAAISMLTKVTIFPTVLEMNAFCQPNSQCYTVPVSGKSSGVVFEFQPMKRINIADFDLYCNVFKAEQNLSKDFDHNPGDSRIFSILCWDLHSGVYHVDQQSKKTDSPVDEFELANPIGRLGGPYLVYKRVLAGNQDF